MKKLFISLALFSILSSEAQQAFEGAWSMEDSSYTTVIIASDYEVLKILNYSFEEDATLNEVILSQTDEIYKIFDFIWFNFYLCIQKLGR